jgi:hypothetical protein
MKYLILFLTLSLTACKTLNEGAVAEQFLGSDSICEDKWVMDSGYTFLVRCTFKGKRYDCMVRGSAARDCVVAGTPMTLEDGE